MGALFNFYSMHYRDHALLSAHKYGCNVEDTLHLHKLMDSSKIFYPKYIHRMFSHNLWFVHVLTELVGDTVPNTKTGGEISVRDILWEHLREDLNGETPNISDWLDNIEIKVKPEDSRWFNRPRKSDLELLEKIKQKENV
jgi:hypothetical protein